MSPWMSEAEMALLSSFLRCSNHYLEFGSGAAVSSQRISWGIQSLASIRLSGFRKFTIHVRLCAPASRQIYCLPILEKRLNGVTQRIRDNGSGGQSIIRMCGHGSPRRMWMLA